MDTTTPEAAPSSAAAQPLDALGRPSPNRTDFTGWSRAGLEKFARNAADEILVLKQQLNDAQTAWRRLVLEIADLRDEANKIAAQHRKT